MNHTRQTTRPVENQGSFRNFKAWSFHDHIQMIGNRKYRFKRFPFDYRSVTTTYRENGLQ